MKVLRSLKQIVFLSFVLCLFAGAVQGDVPEKINFQGRLTDTGGADLTGSYHMRFYLYTQETGGTQIWFEQQSSVLVDNGIYNVLLGATYPLTPDILSTDTDGDGISDSDRPWLEVRIYNGSTWETLFPRLAFSSTAFALRAAGTDKLEGQTLSDLDVRYISPGDEGVVDSTMIADHSIGAADLGADSVDSAKIAPGAVQSSEIKDGSIQAGDLAGGAALKEILDDDGPGSLLDADFLDGLSSDSFVRTSGDHMSGELDIDNLLNSSSSIYGADIVADNDGTGTSYGFKSQAIGSDGTNIAVQAIAENGDFNYAFYGSASGGTSWAGYFYGRVGIDENGTGNDVQSFVFDPVGYSSNPLFRMYDENNGLKVQILARETLTTEGAEIKLYDEDGTNTIELDAEFGSGGGGYLALRNGAGDDRIILDSDFSSEGRITAGTFFANNDVRVSDDLSVSGDASVSGRLTITGDILNDISISTSSITTHDPIFLDAYEDSNGPAIKLRNSEGRVTIELDGGYSGPDGRIITDELQITGGSDLSEQFDVKPVDIEVGPGMVVSIDPENPGNLEVSRTPYDNKVAGIISGANGIKPGMMMGQKGTEADGKHPVALTGRVYCRADASAGPIKPGDLLTTSHVPGHAMKVIDHSKANGAILGKAMTSLEQGRGLVLVLVSLQ